jgi:hypothetical protein
MHTLTIILADRDWLLLSIPAALCIATVLEHTYAHYIHPRLLRLLGVGE